MQKLLKNKNNFKKILQQNDSIQKYDIKNSQTLSTNESKIQHELQKASLLSSPYKNSYSLILKNLKSYGTSNDLFYLTDFEDSFGRTRTRQKILLKDMSNFQDEEHLEKRYSSSESMEELKDLFEYYKYYINNPILYPKDHFKILYNFYEKKKYLQYKRLKAVLDLDESKNSGSDNSVNENISLDPKRSTKQNTKTFYIMNLIQTDLTNPDNPSQSKAFLELNDNLDKMFAKFDSSEIITPQKSPNRHLDKNSTLFKKKKVNGSHVSSLKNTVTKKPKKQTTINSNSLKKNKTTKPYQEPYSSKFIIENIPTFKQKPQTNQKKFRNQSNLSMGDLETKNHYINTVSPKKRQKKRMNSCETVISRNCSQQKSILQKKFKKKTGVQMNLKQFKTQEHELQDFKNFLKKNSTNYRRKTQQKNSELGWDLHSSKIKKQNTPQESQESVNTRKIKRKVPFKNSCGKSSIQRSPSHKTKQNIVQESITNLKKKIQLAKQTIKQSNTSSSSNLHQAKKEKHFKVNIGQKRA